MDLSGLSSPYSDLLTNQLQNAENIKMQESFSANKKDSTEEELMDACKEFEAYFLEQVFKGMEKTVMKSEDKDPSTAHLVEYFKDNTIQELAAQSTENNSLGLAQMLFEQMKRNYGMTEDKPEKDVNNVKETL